MLSLRDLFLYNMDYSYNDTLIVQFEGSDEKYELECEDISNITTYPVYRFCGNEVSLLFHMRKEDIIYFRKIVNEHFVFVRNAIDKIYLFKGNYEECEKFCNENNWEKYISKCNAALPLEIE